MWRLRAAAQTPLQEIAIMHAVSLALIGILVQNYVVVLLFQVLNVQMIIQAYTSANWGVHPPCAPPLALSRTLVKFTIFFYFFISICYKRFHSNASCFGWTLDDAKNTLVACKNKCSELCNKNFVEDSSNAVFTA